MSIIENIKEIAGSPTLFDFVVIAVGLSLFAFWLLKTSFGRRALENSAIRRNNMPIFMPLIIIFVTFLALGLLSDLMKVLFGEFPDGQQVLIDQLSGIIFGIIAIAIILCIVRKFFVRGLKGFGLNIKTIPKDIAGSVLNLVAVWPIFNVAFILTIVVIQLWSGQEYEIPKHEVLQSIDTNQNLPVRIAIAVMAIGITPVLEELLYRGLFQTMIRSALYFKHVAWIAILITSFFFALSHADSSHWPTLFILGVCMGYSYEKSGSLFRPILIHMLFNGSAVIFTWFK